MIFQYLEVVGCQCEATLWAVEGGFFALLRFDIGYDILLSEKYLEKMRSLQYRRVSVTA